MEVREVVYMETSGILSDLKILQKSVQDIKKFHSNTNTFSLSVAMLGTYEPSFFCSLEANLLFNQNNKYYWSKEHSFQMV